MPDTDTHAVTIEPPLANKVMTFAIAAAAAFISLVFITNVDAALFQLVMLIAAVVAGLYAYRTATTRAIATREGLSVHNLRRTVHTPWSDVDHLAVVQLDHNQGTGIDVIPTDGDRLPIEASWGPWYSPRKAEANTKRCEAFISEVNELRTAMGHGSPDVDVAPPPDVKIMWVTAFIDVPADRWDDAVRFWTRATKSTLSEARGVRGEFATLVPAVGDPYLRMQRLDDDGPKIHLDFHVDSLDNARERAVALGATVVEDRGHVIMRSPGGFTFCFVDGGGEGTVPPPDDSQTPNRADQVCLDIPDGAFDRECTFWSGFTGWQLQKGSRVEFRSLHRPHGIPLRFLLQRLGKNDDRDAVSAHLDFGSSGVFMDLLMRHDRYDAERLDTRDDWTVMKDPAGLLYCLTRREPEVDPVADNPTA